MHRLAPAAVLVLLLPLALTGCSGVLDGLQRQAQGSVDSKEDLGLEWRSPASQPAWIPDDATAIRFVAATSGGADASPATVRVSTAAELPADCTRIERRSLDSFGPDWAPDTFPDQVERCGNWAVMPVADGWFGWTPLAPDEVDAPAVGG